MLTSKPLIAFIVPTGIGASIGGFAGDASCFARSFTEDFNVIANPNTVNAACFSGISDSMLYLEGWAFSQFMKGNLNLIPSKNNKIGIIFDKAIPRGILNVHLNVINAMKTVYGINITGYEITEEEAGIDFFETASGISSGSVMNNKTLLEAGRKLIKRGAEALACVCAFPEPPEDDYQNGTGIDIIGGIEAVISHYLTRELKVQTVHAPAFENIEITKELVNPKAAAEYITPSFLPCLLTGLNNAPRLSFNKEAGSLSKNDLKALIMPYNSLGSSTVSDALSSGIKVFAVKENETVLKITKDIIKNNDIIETDTYKTCIKELKEIIYEKD